MANNQRKIATRLTPGTVGFVNEISGFRIYFSDGGYFFNYPNILDFSGFKDGYHLSILNPHGEYEEVSEQEFIDYLTSINKNSMANQNIKIKPLVWETIQGHYGNASMAKILGTDKAYFVWIERTNGVTRCSLLNRQHKDFTNIEEAKEFCQKDFESLILNFIE